jgi:hypothetical protein
MDYKTHVMCKNKHIQITGNSLLFTVQLSVDPEANDILIKLNRLLK